MTATTTAFTACDWVLELDDDGGVLQDISGSLTTAEINFDNQIGEFKVFGTQWKTRVQCGKDATANIKGIGTTAINEIKDLIEDWFFNGGLARTFRLSEPAGTAGNTRYTMEAVLKSYKFSGDANSADPVMYEISLLPTGAVTIETIP